MTNSSEEANERKPDIVSLITHTLALSSELTKCEYGDQLYELITAKEAIWNCSGEVAHAVAILSGHRPERIHDAISSLRAALFKNERVPDQPLATMAVAEMLMGVCQQRQRDFRVAIKHLRSAVTRFQQSEETDRDLFIFALCLLSSCYRAENNREGARSASKQAYKLMVEAQAPLMMQCVVLEEVAACLLAERQYRMAATMYEQVLAVKNELAQERTINIVVPLLRLGLCKFACNQLEDAEESLVSAALSYHESACFDRRLLVQILETLSGVLRCEGQFVQADIVEETAMELQGRLDQAYGHVLYGGLLSEARVAQSLGECETSKNKLRQALCILEAQYGKRAADRLQILTRLFLLTTEEQRLQRISLAMQIGDEVGALHCKQSTDTTAGLERIALLYRCCGKVEAASDLLRLADLVRGEESGFAALSIPLGVAVRNE